MQSVVASAKIMRLIHDRGNNHKLVFHMQSVPQLMHLSFWEQSFLTDVFFIECCCIIEVRPRRGSDNLDCSQTG